jgi:hypothetical protein
MTPRWTSKRRLLVDDGFTAATAISDDTAAQLAAALNRGALAERQVQALRSELSTLRDRDRGGRP